MNFGCKKNIIPVSQRPINKNCELVSTSIAAYKSLLEIIFSEKTFLLPSFGTNMEPNQRHLLSLWSYQLPVWWDMFSRSLEYMYLYDLAKLKYFTNLDFPEIKEIPFLSYHLGFWSCEVAS